MIGVESYALNRYLLDQARGRRRDHQHFTYEGEVNMFSPNDVFNIIQINVDKDAPFLLVSMQGEAFSIDPGATTPLQYERSPSARLMLRYGGSGGVAWAQTPVHWRNCLGYRPVPYVLPAPKLVPAGSQFHLTIFWDNEPSVGNLPQLTFRVQFIGTKLFRWRAA